MISPSTMWLPSHYIFLYNSIVVREHTLYNFNLLKCIEAFCWSASALIGEYFICTIIYNVYSAVTGWPRKEFCCSTVLFRVVTAYQAEPLWTTVIFSFRQLMIRNSPLSHRFSLEERRCYGSSRDHVDLGCFFV